MVEQIETAGDLIDALGGTVTVAKLFGLDARVVSNWRERGLPPDTFLVLDGAMKAKGLSAPPSLWRMREPAQ